MKTEDFDTRLRQRLGHFEPSFDEGDWKRFQHKLNAKENRNDRKAWLWFMLAALTLGSGGAVYSWYKAQDTPKVEAHDLSSSRPIADVKSDRVQSTESLEDAGATKTTDARTNLSASGARGKHAPERIIHRNFMPARSNAKHLDQQDLIAGQNQHVAELATMTKKDEQLATAQTTDEPAAFAATVGMDETVPFGPPALSPLTQLHLAAVDKSLLKLKKTTTRSKWSTGPSLLYAKSHQTYGWVIERNANGNIAIGSGLVYQQYKEQEYINQKAFEDANQVEFTELAKPRHSTAEDFQNIRIQSYDVLLPLYLKYLRPLGSSSAAFVSAGVQFTLHSKTLLNFDYLNYDTNQYITESDLDQSSNRATLMNNFIFNLGYQRKWLGLQWEISGFYQKSNNHQVHIPAQDLGVQTTVSYSF